VVTPNYTYKRLHSKTSTPNISICNQSPELLAISPSTKKWVSQLIDLPSPQKPSDRSNNEIINSPRKIAAKNNILQKKLRNMKKLIKHKRAIITSLRKTNENNKLKQSKQINVHRFFEEAKFPSINSKALISMQLLHKRRKPWFKTEKNMALSLYYKSPSTYKFMRKNGIILPGETTVRRWLNSISFSTGFPKAYMDQIRLKISGMSENEKKCTILLDEVAIMKTLEYNKVLDEIEGYEDLGTLGRTNKIGSQALVVMVRGLYSNWKFPLCYFFTGSGVKGDNLVNIIKDCVQQILDLGLSPTCIICDQGAQNRRMYTLLGGNEDQPSTTICGKKLFLIYDMPHLIKSVRNNLLNGDFEINNSRKVSMNDIRKAYEIDTNNIARAMIKITPTHLNPNPFQKMNCKLAIQLLSNSVSAAIKTCIATGEIKSSTAINTANFIEVVNKMFDSANSKNLCDPNPNRRPMSNRNPQIFENLEKAKKLFKNTIKICHRTKKTSIPPCFIGIVWTTTAIQQLYESEKLEMSAVAPSINIEYFLLTNRLTQDALENFFSIMRQKNGYVENIIYNLLA